MADASSLANVAAQLGARETRLNHGPEWSQGEATVDTATSAAAIASNADDLDALIGLLEADTLSQAQINALVAKSTALLAAIATLDAAAASIPEPG